MSYLVLCTFDLKNADDYSGAYAALSDLGLHRVQANSGGGETVIPTTTVIGRFDGADAVTIAAHVTGRVRDAFKALGLRSEVFVVAGGQDATWMAGTT